MLVLALDTTTRQGSAALTRDRALLDIYIGDAAITHGERLPGDIIRLLSAHALQPRDVELFAVAAGPGSFTGLRVGIATQQGFAFATNRPLVGVSALDALNYATRLAPFPIPLALDSEVAVWMDAQRGQVFSALYSSDAIIEGPTVEKPAEVLARWTSRTREPGLFTGDGALEYSGLIQQVFPDVQFVSELPPLAPAVAHLAENQLIRNGPSRPDAIRPIYVRRSDAELARDRVKL